MTNANWFQIALLAYNLNWWLQRFGRAENVNVETMKHIALTTARLRKVALGRTDLLPSFLRRHAPDATSSIAYNSLCTLSSTFSNTSHTNLGKSKTRGNSEAQATRATLLLCRSGTRRALKLCIILICLPKTLPVEAGVLS
jgi:hypothetical protein